MLRLRHAVFLPIAAAGCLLVTACGSAASSGATTSVPATQAVTAPTSSTSSTSSANAVQKVNANTATQAELTSAFTAAGISNAARWAAEVVEYRPYPTDDATFAKLRSELAKYNPGQATVDQIVASLSV